MKEMIVSEEETAVKRLVSDFFPFAIAAMGSKADKSVDIFERKVRKAFAKFRVTGKTSDGYHTFDELYDHRVTLWIALCKISMMVETDDGESHDHVWRSKLHSDGTSFDGWFLLGFNKKPGEQMTYHLPMSRWSDTDFAETLARAPEFDGHTSADVLERLKEI